MEQFPAESVSLPIAIAESKQTWNRRQSTTRRWQSHPQTERNAMKRIAMYLATAAFGSALLTVGGAAWAQMAAPGQMGNYCTTPQKTCALRSPSYVGIGCSCRVPGGRARGSVTP